MVMPTEVVRKYAITSGILCTWWQQLVREYVDPKSRSVGIALRRGQLCKIPPNVDKRGQGDCERYRA